MHLPAELRKSHRSRFLLFGVGLVSFFALLMVRLADLQLVHGTSYLEKAEENRFYTRRLSSPRGIFFDRYGDPLVLNTQRYFRVENPKALYVKREPISRTEALQLIATGSANVETATERLYRYPESLAHVLGYVGEVTAEDLQRNQSFYIGQTIGKAGLEYMYQQQLRGGDGKEVFEVNALGEKQRQVAMTEPSSGQDISTTIDPYINEVANRALAGMRGAFVMTNTETGEVLALTSMPAFDPNLLSRSFIDKEKELQRKEQIQQFFSDSRKLFFDRVISGAYPPGSVFKLVTALAGLENGKIDRNTTVVDEGKLVVGEYEYGNWYYRQYGRTEGAINLTRSIARSNDIYFYKVAEWTGPEEIAEMARILGLGEKTGINLPAESRGLVPDPEWKAKVKNERWFLGNTYHYGIGQGDLLTSPIQVAQMTQAIGNNGSLCQVSLLQKEERQCREVVVKREDIDLVMEGMIQACSAGGTAFPFFAYNAQRVEPDQTLQQQIDAGAVACKTGTAEFGAADEQGYRKTHGWFTAILTLPELRGTDTAEAENIATASAGLLRDLTSEVNSEDGLLENTATHLTEAELFQMWKQKVEQKGFPRRITLTVMVESDENIPFKEGSRDAAPIAAKVVNWMSGK